MSAYIANKLISLGAVLFCIGATFAWFGYSTLQWQMILICIIIFGYAHFLVGFYYQLRGFARNRDAWQRYVTFFVLTLLSLGFTYLIFKVLGFTAALFFGFLYFLFHGLLNEQTLIERQTNLRVPLLHLGALSIFIISLLTYSVPDQTFFFDFKLNFLPLNEFIITQLFETYYLSLQYFPLIFWVGTASSLGLLTFSWYRSRHTKLAVTVAGLILGTTVLVFIFGAPAYIYMYLLVAGYHFMTWLLFYLFEFKRRGKTAWRIFLLINLALFVSLLVLAWSHFNGNSALLSTFLFDYRVFVAVTYIHISTSFMNDDWCKNLEMKFFTYFLHR